ncbi:MAG: hypothetical protein ACREDR_09985, partial [Blastocatellia bacterium]
VFGCKLSLAKGKQPADAIKALFDPDRRSKWKVDCGQFVQLVNYYALLHTLIDKNGGDEKKGAEAFNQRIGPTIELKRLGSTGLKTKIIWGRDNPNTGVMAEYEVKPGQKNATPVDKGRTKNVEDALDEAPVGSRVEFTNGYTIILNPAYFHENTIKMGKNLFAAHPLERSKFMFFGSTNVLTRDQIVEEMARAADNPEAARLKVYISEIEIYDQP